MFYNASSTHNIYGKMKPFDGISIFDLYFILIKCWSLETCATRLRKQFSKDNPTVGQCSITAFLVQDYYGGEVYGMLLPEGGYHCFNVINGVIFDLTSEQFNGKKLDYTLKYPQKREDHFIKKEKLDRYHLLQSTLNTYTRY